MTTCTTYPPLPKLNSHLCDSLSPIGRALILKDSAAVLRLINTGYSLVQEFPLHFLNLAIQNCLNLEVIDAMIARLDQKQINTVELATHTPLMLAVHKRNVAIIDRLAKAGAEVNSKNKFLSTALHEAMELTPMSDNVHNTRLETIECLLRHGASVDETNALERTPLTLHVELGESDPDIISLLVAKGATPPTVKVRNPHAEIINRAIQTGLALRKGEVTTALSPHFSEPALLSLINAYV